MSAPAKPFRTASWRDLRHTFKDLPGFYQVRRMNPDQSRATDAVAAVRAVFRPRKTVFFFPERPARNSVVYQLCAALGYAIRTDPRRRFDAAVKWQDSTIADAPGLKHICGHAVNVACCDIRKRTVAQVFARVFGYALEINPLAFQGAIVEKSDHNARHDGRILQGPLAPGTIRSDCVYQRLIDNASGGDGMMLDHRVPIVGGVTPLVYLKCRPPEIRFSNEFTRAEIVRPESVLSAAELEKIHSVARQMGLDYGELDVLRDRDGRLFIVDVNPTPHGPPKPLASTDRRRALDLMAPAFAWLLEIKFRQRQPDHAIFPERTEFA